MPVAVMSPQMKREREQAPDKDPLDQIMKGLNIASSVYGIYDRVSAAAENKIKAAKQAELDKQKMAQTETELAGSLAAKGLKKDESGKIVEDTESSFIKSRLADIEKSKEETAIKREAIALEREKIKNLKEQVAFKELPKDQQIQLERFATKKADLDTIYSRFDEIVTQLEDPNISVGQKLQIANQSPKIMNDAFGSDAVAKDEFARLMSYLQPGPDPYGPKGWKIGVDIDGFTQAVKNSRDRVGGTRTYLDNQINTIMGRLPPTPARPTTPQEKAAQQTQPQGGGLLQNRANAAAMPDFTQMSTEDLQKFLGGK